MRQAAGNLYIGRFRVPRKRGEWKIEVLNFTEYAAGAYNACSGTILRFRVTR
jgi:hypothetical protein